MLQFTILSIFFHPIFKEPLSVILATFVLFLPSCCTGGLACRTFVMQCFSISRSILNFWAKLTRVETDDDRVGMSPAELMELCLLPPAANVAHPSQKLLTKQHLANKHTTCLLRQAEVFWSPSCY